MRDYRKTTATNTRGVLFKYYKVNENRGLAVRAGRCHKCKKVTDVSCFKCHKYLCENHMYLREDERYCDDCKPVSARELTKKEKRVFRKAEL